MRIAPEFINRYWQQ